MHIVAFNCFLGLACSVGWTVGGILQPGFPWLFYGPALFISAFMYGRITGILLGINPFIAALLGTLAFCLDFWLMPTGLWGAVLKSVATWFLAQMGSTQGWFHQSRKISDALGAPEALD